jgi:regulator of sigma E protease
MSDFTINLFSMLLTLGILVTIHEFGHYFVARLCGVRVERFSIGFGKSLVSWLGKPDLEGHRTQYTLSWLPLGGFVRMYGENKASSETKPALRKYSFHHKSILQRSMIVAAGPVANFLLAIGLYYVLFLSGVQGIAPVVSEIQTGSIAARAGLAIDVEAAPQEIIAVDDVPVNSWRETNVQLLKRMGDSGGLRLRTRPWGSTSYDVVHTYELLLENWLGTETEPAPLDSLGLVPYHHAFYDNLPPRVDTIFPNTPASVAGLISGDFLVSADGIAINNWQDWLQIVQRSANIPVSLVYDRQGALIETLITPTPRKSEEGELMFDADDKAIGYIGASVEVPSLPSELIRIEHFSFGSALNKAVDETWQNSLFVLSSLKKMLLGAISVKNLSGPLTIAQVAGATVSSGFETFINFLALLSISLGVLNLLPIPVLDGGHLFFYGIEAILRRPVPAQLQEISLRLGMLLVGFIMLLAITNDILRIF